METAELLIPASGVPNLDREPGRDPLFVGRDLTKIYPSGELEIRALDGVDLDLFEGELGDRYRLEARIVTWHGNDVLQVPAAALFRHGNSWMVFVAKDGRAMLRKVEIVHNDGIAAEVLSGLAQGDAVIIHPPDAIHDGVPIVSSG